jgi:Terminase-like family.
MVSAFNQELMLKILSDDERLVSESELQFYDRRDLLKNKNAYNFYITTDFAVTDKQSSDYSVISVWAVSYNGMFFWVDGMVKRQNISKTIEELFNFNEIYHPVQVGVEVTGQQQGFIDIIQKEMLRRNNFINFASDKNSNRPGIRPNTNKMVRFQNVVPWFHLHKFWFPSDLVDSKDPG